MSISVEYLAARYTSARWVVAGRVMRPFCVDSFEQLTAINSPCIQHGQLMSIDDIRTAATICSAPVGRGYLHIYRRASWLYWRMARRLYSVALEQCKWEAYLADNYATPQIWSKPSDSPRPPSSTPWTLAIELRLTRAGYPLDHIRSMPLGLAIWTALAISESEGGARPVSAQERAILDHLKAQQPPEYNV